MRNSRSRLVYYILLNVFVSALVTLTILFFYDRANRDTQAQPIAPLSTSSGTSLPQIMDSVEIASVVGSGSLSTETVLIRYTGNGELDLTGWELQDGEGNTYRFPGLKLFPNGAVQVHTASGTDTVVDLYWGQLRPIWQAGELASLVDPNGAVRATYRIP
jgi:hypothetical protein